MMGQEDAKRAFAYLYRSRGVMLEGDKFYFRLVGGDYVVGHKWIIQGVTTTKLNGNELVVPEDTGKPHVEAFLKFLYVKQFDLDDDRMSFSDMAMILGMCNFLSLKEPVRRELCDSIKSAISEIEKSLRGTSANSQVLEGGEINVDVGNGNDEDGANAESVGTGSQGMGNVNDQDIANDEGTVSASSNASTSNKKRTKEDEVVATPDAHQDTRQNENTVRKSLRQVSKGIMQDRPVSHCKDCKREREVANCKAEGKRPQEPEKTNDSSKRIKRELSLNQLVAKAGVGETIKLMNREYSLKQLLRITKENVTIEGSGPKTVLSDNRKDPKNRAVLQLCKNGITIRNLIIKLRDVEWKQKLPDRWGIFIEADNCKLENVRFENCGIAMQQYRHTLRHLEFHAERGVNQAIRILGLGQSGHDVPGGDNILDDISIHNYGLGIFIYGSAQGGNTISNINFQKVCDGVVIEGSKNNTLTNLKYECPPGALDIADNEEECFVLMMCSGAKNNKIDGLECHGFREGMRVRSIFIGESDAGNIVPEQNIVTNWNARGLLPAIICEEGNNKVATEDGESSA